MATESTDPRTVWREQQRANGRCGVCGGPHPEWLTRAYCRGCRLKNALRAKASYERRIGKGVAV